MPSCAASLAAGPVPAVVPLEGLLAGAEPPDDVAPDVVPPDDVPVVEPPVGDEAPLAPLVVDPVDDPELPPPQAARAATRAEARRIRVARTDPSDKACSKSQMVGQAS